MPHYGKVSLKAAMEPLANLVPEPFVYSLEFEVARDIVVALAANPQSFQYSATDIAHRAVSIAEKFVAEILAKDMIRPGPSTEDRKRYEEEYIAQRLKQSVKPGNTPTTQS